MVKKTTKEHARTARVRTGERSRRPVRRIREIRDILRTGRDIVQTRNDPEAPAALVVLDPLPQAGEGPEAHEELMPIDSRVVAWGRLLTHAETTRSDSGIHGEELSIDRRLETRGRRVSHAAMAPPDPNPNLIQRKGDSPPGHAVPTELSHASIVRARQSATNPGGDDYDVDYNWDDAMGWGDEQPNQGIDDIFERSEDAPIHDAGRSLPSSSTPEGLAHDPDHAEDATARPQRHITQPGLISEAERDTTALEDLRCDETLLPDDLSPSAFSQDSKEREGFPHDPDDTEDARSSLPHPGSSSGSSLSLAGSFHQSAGFGIHVGTVNHRIAAKKGGGGGIGGGVTADEGRRAGGQASSELEGEDELETLPEYLLRRCNVR